MSSRLRENTSDHAPEGTSLAIEVSDQMRNSEEICASESPVSANSTA